MARVLASGLRCRPELADSWSRSECPEFAYSCSPHRIALLAARIRDFYTDDFAHAVLQLVPDPRRG